MRRTVDRADLPTLRATICPPVIYMHTCRRSFLSLDDALLREMQAHIVTPAPEGHWAPGYFYALFEGPDGIPLEKNQVPGQGVLAESACFNPGND
jgi:hypothetical protein